MRLDLLGFCTPLLSPHWPCAYRPADPRFARPSLFSPPKSHPKFHSIFEGILAPKMIPKASQNGAKIDPKSIIFPSSFSCRFFFSFRRCFLLIFEGPDPRSNCYLRHFSGVRHFSKSQEKYQKRPPKNDQNDTKTAPRGLQNCIQKPSQKKT